MILHPISSPKYSIKFKGTIDRKYHDGYVDPNLGRFKIYSSLTWTTTDYALVKGFVSTYNNAAHRNKREAENIYTIVQLDAADKDCYWEKDI